MDKGAHFFLTDLQVHSPRDGRWRGSDAVTDEDRRAYAESLVQVCRDKGVKAIAITDHHDLAFASYVREAARNEKDGSGKLLSIRDQLVVFPGVELTLAVPCQALLLFDSDFPETLFEPALMALGITPTDKTLSKAADPKKLEHLDRLSRVYEELDKHDYLKGRYILLPNVTEKGHGSIIRKDFAPKYKEMPCVGGYVDGSKKFGKGATRILSGNDQNWGNKRVVPIRTSDTRAADHKGLANPGTWIKWAEPTAEALRQACLGADSRISEQQPTLPHTYISALHVSNSVFLGPVDLDFNQQYNAIIGGRGTGKSTLLEYLRWALCDQPPSHDPTHEIPDHQARRSALVEGTLLPVKGVVDVTVVVNGVEHIVRRHSSTGELLLAIGDQEFEDVNEDEVRAIAPIQAFSQKQLSSVSVRADELERFVELPIRPDLDEFSRGFTETGAKIREVHAAVVGQRILSREIARKRKEIASKQKQLEGMRKELTGLEPADAAVLEEYSTYQTGHAQVRQWNRFLQSVQDSLDGLKKSLSKPQRRSQGAQQLKSEHLESAEVAIEEFRRTASGSVDQLSAELAALTHKRGKYGQGVSGWEVDAKAFAERYAQAKERSTVQRRELDRIIVIENELQELEAELEAAEAALMAAGNLEQEYEHLWKAWEKLHAKRTEIVENRGEALARASDGQLRFSLVEAGLIGTNIENLKTAVSGSGVRGARLEALESAILSSDDSLGLWRETLKELELLAIAGQDPESSDLPKTPTVTEIGFTDSERKGIASRLTLDRWLDVAVRPIRDRSYLQYKVRKGEYIDFHDASAGQQATALLTTLLNESGSPLIIDQPEDDLDNQIVLDVVRDIWQAKKVRQLIFSSHNANLVVNGDAELVVSCDYRKSGDQAGGKISSEGAIDVRQTRDTIKLVMEGGEAAFKLRHDRYGF